MTTLKAKIGGSWQDVLSGYASNTWVGPDQPTDPSMVFWVDTDAQLTPVPWINLVLVNSWYPVAAHITPRYRRIGDMVQLEGAIARNPVLGAGVIDSQFSTLPEGYRPLKQVTMAAVFGGSDASGGSGRIQILNTGILSAVQTADNTFPSHLCSFYTQFSVL